MTSLFFRQLVALVRRNFLLKRRKWKQTLFEFLVPVYFAAILAAVKLGVNPDKKPAILDPPCWDQRVIPSRINSTLGLLFSPNTSSQVLAIMNNAATSIGVQPIGFTNESDVLAFYARSRGKSDVVGAVIFKDIIDGQIPTTYDLRFDSDDHDIPKTTTTFLANEGFCRDPSSLMGSSDGNTFLCPTISLLGSGFMQVQSAVDSAIIQVPLATYLHFIWLLIILASISRATSLFFFLGCSPLLLFPVCCCSLGFHLGF